MAKSINFTIKPDKKTEKRLQRIDLNLNKIVNKSIPSFFKKIDKTQGLLKDINKSVENISTKKFDKTFDYLNQIVKGIDKISKDISAALALQASYPADKIIHFASRYTKTVDSILNEIVSLKETISSKLDAIVSSFGNIAAAGFGKGFEDLISKISFPGQVSDVMGSFLRETERFYVGNVGRMFSKLTTGVGKLIGLIKAISKIIDWGDSKEKLKIIAENTGVLVKEVQGISETLRNIADNLGRSKPTAEEGRGKSSIFSDDVIKRIGKFGEAGQKARKSYSGLLNILRDISSTVKFIFTAQIADTFKEMEASITKVIDETGGAFSAFKEFDQSGRELASTLEFLNISLSGIAKTVQMNIAGASAQLAKWGISLHEAAEQVASFIYNLGVLAKSVAKSGFEALKIGVLFEIPAEDIIETLREIYKISMGEFAARIQDIGKTLTQTFSSYYNVMKKMGVPIRNLVSSFKEFLKTQQNLILSLRLLSKDTKGLIGLTSEASAVYGVLAQQVEVDTTAFGELAQAINVIKQGGQDLASVMALMGATGAQNISNIVALYTLFGKEIAAASDFATAFKNILMKVYETGNPLARLVISMLVPGFQSIIALGDEGILNLANNIEKLSKEFHKSSKVLNDYANSIKRVDAYLEAVQKNTQRFFALILAHKGVNEIMVEFANIIDSSAQKLDRFTKAIGSDAIYRAMAFLMTIIKQLTSVLNMLGIGITDLIALIWLSREMSIGWGNTFQKLLESFEILATKTYNAVTAPFYFTIDAMNSLRKGIPSIFNFLISRTSKIKKSISEIFTSLWKIVEPLFTKLWSGLKLLAETAFKFLAQRFTKILNFVSKVALGVIGVFNFLKDKLGGIIGEITKIMWNSTVIVVETAKIYMELFFGTLLKVFGVFASTAITTIGIISSLGAVISGATVFAGLLVAAFDFLSKKVRIGNEEFSVLMVMLQKFSESVLFLKSILQKLVRGEFKDFSSFINSIISGLKNIWGEKFKTKEGEYTIFELFYNSIITGLEKVAVSIPQIIADLGIKIIDGIALGLYSIAQRGVNLKTTRLGNVLATIVVNSFKAAFQIVSHLIANAPFIVENLLGAIKTIFQQIVNTVSSGKGIANFITNLAQALLGVLRAVVFFLADNLPLLIEGVADAIDNLVNSISAKGASEFIVLIDSLVNKLLEALPKITSGLGKLLGSLINALIPIIGGLILYAVNKFPDILKAIVSSILSFAKSFMPGLIKALSTLIGKILPALVHIIVSQLPGNIATIIKALRSLLGIIADYLDDIVREILKGLAKAIGALFSGIFSGDFWKNLGNMLLEGLKGLAEIIRSGIMVIWGFLKGLFEDVYKGLKGIYDFIVGIVNKIIGKSKNSATKAYEAVGDINLPQKIEPKFDEQAFGGTAPDQNWKRSPDIGAGGFGVKPAEETKTEASDKEVINNISDLRGTILEVVARADKQINYLSNIYKILSQINDNIVNLNQNLTIIIKQRSTASVS